MQKQGWFLEGVFLSGLLTHWVALNFYGLDVCHQDAFRTGVCSTTMTLAWIRRQNSP